MPSKFPTASGPLQQNLVATIANVETQYLPDLPNRAADDKLNLTPKPNYKRHTLVGLNAFANEMFQQFPQLLGNTAVNLGGKKMVAPLVLAQQEMQMLGLEHTVDMKITQLPSTAPINHLMSRSPT